MRNGVTDKMKKGEWGDVKQREDMDNKEADQCVCVKKVSEKEREKARKRERARDKERLIER
jgi:hypothetical protein